MVNSLQDDFLKFFGFQRMSAEELQKQKRIWLDMKQEMMKNHEDTTLANEILEKVEYYLSRLQE